MFLPEGPSVHGNNIKDSPGLLPEKTVVQLLSCVKFFVTSWTAACQASLSFTVSQSLLKLMSVESVMPSYHPENYWKAVYIFEEILIEVYLIYNVSGVQQSDSVIYKYMYMYMYTFSDSFLVITRY